jgi:ATP-dependent DNA helicase RecG
MALPPDTPLRFLPGVGPARAAALAAAGLETAWDVLHRVPRSLGAPPPLHPGGSLPRGEAVRVRARLTRARPLFGRGRARGLGAEGDFAQADGTPLRARFFNAAWLRRHLVVNEWYLLEGRCDGISANLLLHPSFIHLAGGADQPLPAEGGLRTAYRLPEGFAAKGFAAIVERCLAEALPAVQDPAGELPAADYQRVLLGLHRPGDPAEHERGRRLLAQRELLALAWRLQGRRRTVTAQPGRAWGWSDEIHRRALARLPFALTEGQAAALAELRADLQAPAPMYRLLQGDVGSGKTALALVAALAVIADGAQVLLLAPTAVLARQHAAFVERCLAGSRVRWAVLTGGSDAGERRRILADLAGHRLDLVLGTHALLEEDVAAARLGLAIVDEQHKFGVAQRAALLARRADADLQPDLLLMTATPIPRTLALTAFGDLAVSRIVGRPPGRAAVRTEVRTGGADAAEGAVAECLEQGGQAFVICPLREESGTVAAGDAIGMHRRLAARFGGDRVELLHGALGEEAKLAALARFAAGAAPVLVATTVVEVGIDVPQATLLVVLDAERFGLAQLHQLRGRIGRGGRAGRCLLLHAGDGSGGDRLAVLAASDDGLAIAEADLAQRGPGHLLGTDQHGALRLAIAELPADLDLLQAAHQRVRAEAAAGAAMPAGLAPFARWLGLGDALAGG